MDEFVDFSDAIPPFLVAVAAAVREIGPGSRGAFLASLRLQALFLASPGRPNPMSPDTREAFEWLVQSQVRAFES